MGRGKIRIIFRDLLASGEPAPTKDGSFNAASIPRADGAVFRELKAAVAKIESRIGIDLPQSNLGFTDDNRGFIGVHFGSGDSRTVLLQRAFFNRNSREIIRDLEREFKSKYSVPSNSALQYVVVHELGHSIWVDRVEGVSRLPALVRLDRGIRGLYKRFRRDQSRGKTPISRYAETNINEFFAETFVKAIIGKQQNYYSRNLLKLLKENKDILKRFR